MPDVMPSEDAEVDAFEPLRSAPPEIRRIIEKVLTLEKERLYQKAPHLNDDVLQVIKEEIR